MTQSNSINLAPVAHDGDWYYSVAEDELDKAYELSSKLLHSRFVLSRKLAERGLRKLLRTDIDLAIDDTDPLYVQAEPLTISEIAEEISKNP
jgi:hypothetical protein